MKVLVIGSGGREHALVWKLAQSARIDQILCAPGNAGIATIAECIPIAADNIAALKDFALSERVGLTVVGPEVPLALGLVDEFRKARLKVFGPTRAAAQVESSKAFSKDLMVRCRIPTAAAAQFDAVPPALDYIEHHGAPLVIKADGLAQGKGVVVARTKEEASQAVASMLERDDFGAAGRRILIEEFLDGAEATIMAFTDGKTVLPMMAAQDHKRVNDGDTGGNTGGMGAYAPAPLVTPAIADQVLNQVFHPVVEALARLGSPFQGVLYAGLMIVDDKPFVLEFNSRFGDPETQVVLPLLQTDLLDVVEAVVEHRLEEVTLNWHARAAVCVVMTAAGYPGTYETGKVIMGLETQLPDVTVFHAGTRRDQNHVVTAGGRVLGVTGVGHDLRVARDRAYAGANVIQFEGRHVRTDIAQRALFPVST